MELESLKVGEASCSLCVKAGSWCPFGKNGATRLAYEAKPVHHCQDFVPTTRKKLENRSLREQRKAGVIQEPETLF